jgi:pimeloyl-ACP methyl ester carboxylesterase
MAVFVLVHGAWGGAHGFRKVRGPLQEASHEVFTPSLTGIGERAHLTSPQVSLTTHIADVVNAVWYEDLSDIVLLGYSYGGVVVTGALEHIGDRVRHLVYLDAFVPGDGETVASLGGATAGSGLAALAATGWSRRFPVSTTTRPRRRGPDRGARRTRPAVSPSRSGWRARWRTTRSPAPTSRRPASPGPMTAGRSGPRRTAPWPRRPGATGKSPPTT